MASTASAAAPIGDQLAPRMRGDVLRPDHGGYDEARAVWNAMIDRRPGVIARCRGTADVMAAVDFAREHELLLSVRGGGHSIPGKSVCDDGMMLDLSPMRAVRVDPAAKRLRVQGGALWRDVDHETQAFGLATTGGLVSHTGVAGLTLGGGIGYLARKHGLALDNLVSADVVTADGERVHASEAEHPDLFWGLRGGGGNFGVVTSFEFRLHPLDPEVLGGVIVHPMEAAGDALRFYREFAAEAPDEVACYALIGHVPPAPPFPEAHRGRPALFFAVCHAGPVEEGESTLRPLLEYGDPVLTAVQPQPYATLQRSFDEGQGPGNRWYAKSLFTDEISDGAIDALLDHVTPLPGPLSMAFFEPMGGAIGRIDPGATAFPHREAAYSFGVFGGWMDPAHDETNVSRTREIFAAVRPYGSGVYVNYLDRDEDERVRAAYGDNHDRLVALKDEWDRDNLFRMNQNIEPTT